MKRMTVFHGDKTDFVQAVITSDVFGKFEALGFVDSVDKLKAKKTTRKAKASADGQ